LAGGLSMLCAWSVVDRWPLCNQNLVKCPLWVSQFGQPRLPSSTPLGSVITFTWIMGLETIRRQTIRLQVKVHECVLRLHFVFVYISVSVCMVLCLSMFSANDFARTNFTLRMCCKWNCSMNIYDAIAASAAATTSEMMFSASDEAPCMDTFHRAVPTTHEFNRSRHNKL